MALTQQQIGAGIRAGNPQLTGRLGELIEMQPTATPPTGLVTPSNNSGLINDTFQQVLGRAPSAEVLQFYQNQLAQGLSPEEFIGQVSNSPEALRRGETPQAPGAEGLIPPPTGVIGSEQALQGGLQASLEAVLQSIAQGREDVSGTGQQSLDLINRGVSGFDPFIGRGQQAGQLQAALSGALGPAAQARAFRDFQSSPGQDFLTGEIEKSILRNASATGGLGGGNVLKALQDRALGLAQTDFGNFFGRLGEVANQGLQGAGGAGGLLTSGAGVLQNIGSQLGNFAVGGGQNIASLLTGAARDVSAGRTQAGRDISSAIGGTTSALSDLQERGGAGAADITGSGAAVLAEIINNAGQGLAGDELILAQLLANLATNEGTQLSGAQLSRGGEGQGGSPGLLPALLS